MVDGSQELTISFIFRIVGDVLSPFFYCIVVVGRGLLMYLFIDIIFFFFCISMINILYYHYKDINFYLSIIVFTVRLDLLV